MVTTFKSTKSSDNQNFHMHVEAKGRNFNTEIISYIIKKLMINKRENITVFIQHLKRKKSYLNLSYLEVCV